MDSQAVTDATLAKLIRDAKRNVHDGLEELSNLVQDLKSEFKYVWVLAPKSTESSIQSLVLEDQFVFRFFSEPEEISKMSMKYHPDFLLVDPSWSEEDVHRACRNFSRHYTKRLSLESGIMTGSDSLKDILPKLRHSL